MDFFATEFWGRLLALILIDLVLAGDNAIVIGMTASRLPKHQRNKAIFWGTAGAIILRIISLFIIVWLLKIPAIMLIGGLLLILIAYKLLTEHKEHNINISGGLYAATRNIIIADGVMSLDNVLGIAGVAHNDLLLAIIGMLLTIPIIVTGSTLFIKLLKKFPAINYIGGAILAWTAGSMIFSDPLLSKYLGNTLEILLTLLVVSSVMLAAWFKNRLNTHN